MSKATRAFFDNLKDAATALAPGLQNLMPDLKAEASRMMTQGTMELASALFNGNSFVPYGPGQYTPSTQEPAKENEAEVASRDQGMER